ncbi:transketolase, thiamine diphosphate binding domain protein [Bordetella holmesii 44057]|nr:transketolase, thiamine diphosphate binding domain protein [Bordetella holmesii 44057]
MSARPAAVDSDAAETAEWRDALSSLFEAEGGERASYVLDCLLEHAGKLGVKLPRNASTPYLNTIGRAEEPAFPGDLDLEARLAGINRWNALAMVVRANQAHGELGGHIASYASEADLFEVGFNHFFRAGLAGRGSDLVYMQPHSAPGIYARAFLEGFLEEEDLALFRQEIAARAQGRRGLSSYPHPWLMPDFWQFPTGSMGIGPINAIYQARYMRYLEHRGLATESDRRVWGIFGDGEMDEPESIAALTLAAREKLDNLVFVINCNLQRLDGPVRGNGRIIDELETLYAGRNGMSSSCCGAETGMPCLLPMTRRRWLARSRTRWTANSRPLPPRMAPTTGSTSSARIPRWPPWLPTWTTVRSTGCAVAAMTW